MRIWDDPDAHKGVLKLLGEGLTGFVEVREYYRLPHAGPRQLVCELVHTPPGV